MDSNVSPREGRVTGSHLLVTSDNQNLQCFTFHLHDLDFTELETEEASQGVSERPILYIESHTTSLTLVNLTC